MRPRRFPDLLPCRRAITFAAIGLLAPFIVGPVSSAHAGDIAPTGIKVAATTVNTDLGDGPAVPKVLIQAGGSFTLTVSLSPSDATFKKATQIDLTPSLDPVVGGSPHGTFSPSTITFPAGVPSASFPVSYSAADNGVILTATVDSPNEKVAAGSTEPFDVVSTLLLLAHDNPQLATGVGVGDSSCSRATTEPECGIVVLPNGIDSPKAAFTLGRCTPALLRCTNGSQVIQFIADLGTRYSPINPATLIVRCDKQLCRNTNNGIRAFTLKVSQSASGPLDRVSQPCAAKGIADNGLLNNDDTFCTDYVQSHRDNSGDLLLYLLFTEDMRAST
jgi:hypothetical protein